MQLQPQEVVHLQRLGNLPRRAVAVCAVEGAHSKAVCSRVVKERRSCRPAPCPSRQPGSQTHWLVMMSVTLIVAGLPWGSVNVRLTGREFLMDRYRSGLAW